MNVLWMFINLGNMLTSHWFLIVLSQVDQIPQSWVELFHHTLGGWRQKEETVSHDFIQRFNCSTRVVWPHWVNRWVTVHLTECHHVWLRWGKNEIHTVMLNPADYLLTGALTFRHKFTCMPCKQSWFLWQIMSQTILQKENKEEKMKIWGWE